MPHKLERFSKSILEQPLLISAERFKEISEFLDTRNSELYNDTYKAALAANARLEKNGGRDKALVETSVGVLRIQGSLTYKPTFWSAMSGGCSYQELLEDMDELCAMSNVTDILMDVDSGGGEAYSTFYTAQQLRKKADESGKRLIAYVDGSACSAAYALTCAAHEVVMRKPAQVGSIGVLIQLMNDSKALEKEGLKRVFITCGKDKIPYDKESGDFREEFLSDLQERVDELYSEFISHVASMRGIDEDVVRNTQAKVFSANKALELGLVDKIMEPEEFYDYLAGGNSEEDGTKMSSEETSVKGSDLEVVSLADDKTTEKVKTEMETPELSPELQAKLDKLAEYEAQEVADKKASFTATVEGAGLSNVDGIVEALMAEDETSTLLSGIIEDIAKMKTDAAEELASKVAEHEETLTSLKEEHEAALEVASTKVEEVKEEASAIKEEFGKEEGIEGDNASLEDADADAKKKASLAEFITKKYSK